MNKAELITAMSNETGITKTDTEKQLNAFIKIVSEELAKKANSSEIPTKLSQLEKDIEIGTNSPFEKGLIMTYIIKGIIKGIKLEGTGSWIL